MENNKGKNLPPQDYSVDEILAEAKGRLSPKAYELLAEDETQRQPTPPLPQPEQPAQPVQPQPDISTPAQPAPQEMPLQQPSPGQNGEIRFEKQYQQAEEELEEDEEEPEQPAEKRGLGGFFERRRRKKAERACEFEEEGDIYYGLQLKPVEEYKKGYDDGAAPENGPTPAFRYLFDETPASEVEEEISARFQPFTPERPIYLVQEQLEQTEEEADTEPEPVHVAPKEGKRPTPQNLPQDGQEGATVEFHLPSVPTYRLKQEPLPFPKENEPFTDLEAAARIVQQSLDAPEPQPKKKKRKEKPAPVIKKEQQALHSEVPVQEVEAEEEERKAQKALQEEKARLELIKQEEARQAELQKKEQIRQLVKDSPKFLPELLPVHVLEFDRFEMALTKAEEDYLAPPQQEQPEAPHKKKAQKEQKGVHSFRFTGEVEDDNEPEEEPAAPTEEENLDDYTAQEDAPSILHELTMENRRLALRLSVTGIVSVAMLFWGFVSERTSMLPAILQVEILPLAYFIANLCLLSIAIGFCWITVFGGIRALLRLQANSDSAVAVAAVAAWIQGVMLLFYQQEVTSAHLHLYAVLASLGLFLNTAGKFSMVRRIRANFKFLSSPEPKTGIELFDDYNTALQLAKGCVVGEPVIAYQKKIGFFKNFLRNSYEPDPSEQASQSMAPLLFIGSLVLCIASLILTKSAGAAVTAFAAAACIGAPVTNMLCVNLPISRLCALARRCGTMLVGNPAVEYYCNTNALMMDAKELFPKGTVILNGIKTFQGQRIDEAIMDATAMMCTIGGPLSDLFEQIIQNRREILPKAERVAYEEERGVTGWVSGRRTLVGNRYLLEQHGLTPPSRDYENKYLLGGKKVVYLASEGELVAMFVISYNSDKRRALELRRMEENGISLVLRTTDPSMTPEFVAECFGLDPHSVRVLPEPLGETYRKLAETPRERADALFVSKGRPASMMRMLTACVREKSNVTMATLLQTVGAVLGFVLVAFLVLYSGLEQLTTLALVAYQIFWMVAILLIPKLRKP